MHQNHSELLSSPTKPNDDAAILFSKPFHAPREMANLRQVVRGDHAHGDGDFTRSATQRLTEITGAAAALLTTSGSHALELASRLLDLGPGDEVILPSFTFPSAANAIALTGATCVFVDVDMRNGNIDPQQVAEAITPRTKAISVVSYGGVAVDFEAITAIADEHGLAIIEDNAHGLGGAYRGQALGTFGVVGVQSFHDTKNVHCGEGGAILINDVTLLDRAEIMREKGTNRARFLRGQIDKYTWVDIGSSYLLSEYNAAVLDSQLESFTRIQQKRHAIWNSYATRLPSWAADENVRLMDVPADRRHPAHLFFLQTPDHDYQVALLAYLRSLGVFATFHYIPLDSAPAGLKHGRRLRELTQSQSFSDRLVRLPLWAGMRQGQIDRVIEAVSSFHR
ncbi:dTDP-4-amino-4,6-dideoxygalactose transaminase [Agreia sp. PsM10]|uniref:dTDP-4-amino-4,6-dideoxygalactose transaminase n=1 Tax=Agreia sp. PsM10 TaxID=3030533 RepID=UPI00263AD597|nr:dTDP-4-amino-4,6-dideoxygalactose transaminase [Agreia sp. PsM10]MDN4639276.1 dTDP-4-amino-4,6-dideoxygalactose transaminase [Agreia sp. PsM10]